jgi:hypothetical protein
MSTSLSFSNLTCSLVLCLGIAHTARAQFDGTEAAIFIPTTATHTGIGSGTETLGYSFTLDDDKTLTHLGIFSRNGAVVNDPVPDRHIAVWDSGGDIVADATLVFADGVIDPVQVLHAPRYIELDAPVVLAAGDYIIGAWYQPNPPGVTPLGVNLPGISYNYSEWVEIPGFHYGQTMLTDNTDAFGMPTLVPLLQPDLVEPLPRGFFGPTMRFTIAAVPAPAALPAGLALLGLAAARRRRRAN